MLLFFFFFYRQVIKFLWFCMTKSNSCSQINSLFVFDIWTQDQPPSVYQSVSVENHAKPSAPHQYPKTSGEHLPPIMDVLVSPVTNEVAMELQLLAEITNDIFGTGQVFSAGGNLTPPNGTAGREKRVWPSQTCWCYTTGARVCVCLIVSLYL